MNRICFSFIAICFLIFSCREPIQIGIEKVDRKIVIEGLILRPDKGIGINDMNTTYFFVRRSYYFGEKPYDQIIKDAQIVVSDDQDNSYDFHYTEEIPKNVLIKEDDGKKFFHLNDIYVGRYETKQDIKVKDGATYTATVKADGKTYKAEYKSIKPPYVEIKSKEKADIFDLVTLDVTNVKNALVRYGEISYDSPEWHDDIMFFGVIKKTNSNISRFILSSYFSPKETSLQFISISNDIYNYFSRLNDNKIDINNNIFSNSPYFENIGNWNNGAMGYFLVSNFHFAKFSKE